MHRGFQRSTLLLYGGGGLIIPDPSGCSVGASVLAKISLEDTGCPGGTAGGHCPDGQDLDLEGEPLPEGGMPLVKASGRPRAEPGRVSVLPPPRATGLRDGGSRALAVAGPVDRAPSLSLRVPAVHPEALVTHS